MAAFTVWYCYTDDDADGHLFRCAVDATSRDEASTIVERLFAAKADILVVRVTTAGK